MEQGPPAEKPSLSVEEVSSGTLAVAAERDLAGMASHFFALVQSWAAPTVVLCIAKDASAEAGWRLIPELTSGPVPPGFERSIAKFIGDSPAGSLAHPALVRPVGEVSGSLHVKLRDSWIVPWSCGGASGFLLMRGIPRPYPPNLGDAVALASQPLWPRLEKPKRLEDLVEQARSLSERLAAEIREQSERLRPDTSGPPAAEAGEISALREKVAALEASRSETEAERDRVRRENEAEHDRARREAEELRGRAEEARRELTALRTKHEALDKAHDAAEQERSRAESEAAELRDQVERLERQAEAQKTLAGKGLRTVEEGRSALEEAQRALEESRRAQDELQRALEESRRTLEQSRSGAQSAERLAAERLSALEEARREATGLRDRLGALEKERASVDTERGRAKTEANQLWSSIESLQRQLQADKERFEAEKAALEEGRRALERSGQEAASARAAVERERDEARAVESAATRNAAQAVERARLLEHRWEESVGAFRAALEALRRTPFVPPTLRVSLGAVEGFLGAEGPGASPSRKLARILLLDRETPGLERLASELESGGIEVLIAHYPEEVGFFLKTPDSRRLTALVCDVMAFRPDQDLTALLRTWRHDLPDLGLLLSFKADNPTEAERAQRVPSVLTSGYLQRPLQREALLEAVGAIAKRQTTR